MIQWPGAMRRDNQFVDKTLLERETLGTARATHVIYEPVIIDGAIRCSKLTD
jgi:hypothetical protein